MGIRQITPMSEIDRKIEENVERAKKTLVRYLHYVGEQVVNAARNLPSPPSSIYWNSESGNPLSSIPPHKPNYIDWTANLRSSIGYIVVVDGKVYKGNSPSFDIVGNGKEGTEKGEKYASELAKQYPSGVVLIVVAGMQYAKYVQARGYDVTLTAEQLASKLLLQLGLPNIKRIE